MMPDTYLSSHFIMVLISITYLPIFIVILIQSLASHLRSIVATVRSWSQSLSKKKSPKTIYISNLYHINFLHNAFFLNYNNLIILQMINRRKYFQYLFHNLDIIFVWKIMGTYSYRVQDSILELWCLMNI